MVEGDLASKWRQLGCCRPVRDCGPEIEQLEDPLDAGPGLLGGGEDASEHPGRGDQLGEIGGKGEERADRDPVIEREPAAEREHRDLTERRDGLQQRLVTRLQPHRPQV